MNNKKYPRPKRSKRKGCIAIHPGISGKNSVSKSEELKTESPIAKYNKMMRNIENGGLTNFISSGVMKRKPNKSNELIITSLL